MSDLPFPDDELVSAYLDGEVDADQRARVEGDPALMARADELGRVRGLVRAPLSEPAADDVDRTIAAALAAARDSASRDRPVHSLEDRRRPSSLPAWLSVAALVLGLLVAVSLVGNVIGGGDDDEESAETAALSDSDEDTETFESSDAGGGAEQAGEPSADDVTNFAAAGPVDLGDLGAIADERALAEAVGPAVTARRAAAGGDGATAGGSAGEDSAASTTTVTAPAAAPRCERPDLGEPVLRATGVYDGTEAVVFAFDQPEGKTRVLVLAVDSCGVIADFTL